jgi:hypothetical protein
MSSVSFLLLVTCAGARGEEREGVNPATSN